MQESQPAEMYKVALTGGGITVDRTVSQDVARKILDLILGGTGNISTGSIHRASHQQGNDGGAFRPSEDRHRPSLREFVDDVGARSNPDKIVAIGEYMIEHEGAEDFSRDEIKVRFRTAGESIPKNIHRDFASAVQNIWIAEDPNKLGRFYVTKKGKDAIAHNFSSGTKASAYKSGARRRARNASPNAETTGDFDE